jgi:hypothetical protein
MENPPEVCKRIFYGNVSLYSKDRDRILGELTIDDLLTVQRCGLAFHPQHQLSRDIANHNEYPVPALIHRLQTDDDEGFQYYLILAFVKLPESSKHRARFKSDESLVVPAITEAISRMSDSNIRRNSQAEFAKITAFFDQ